MKLPLLLAQYLYQNKKLTLPGIGTFTIENGQQPVPLEDKHASHPVPVQFQPTTEKEFDPILIDFIKTQTGKMRSLAQADLESYIMDIKEFINIGKPCFLEGIGSLIKNRDGSYSFSPGEAISTKLEEIQPVAHEKAAAVHDKDYYTETPTRNTARNLLVLFAAVAGLGLIGWGGYFFYSKYQSEQAGKMPLADSGNTVLETPAVNANDSLVQDSAITVIPAVKDTASSAPAVSPAGNVSQQWNFVLRKGSPAAARKRFQQLKEYGTPVELKVVDSTFAKVYITMPCAISDTLRIKDSLKVYYGYPVTIERH